MKVETRLTSLFKVRYPIMSAPMSMHSGATLAAAVTHAGGIGMFGAIGPGGEAWLSAELVKAKALMGNKPFGIGFITHLMADRLRLFELALEARVPVMAFSFADPAPYLERARAIGSITLCQVRTIKEAEEARAAGTHILVAQGNEAGGHTGETNLMPFLLRLLDRFPDTPVLAAGGISSGRALAAVLAAGADGAWIGTPLLATPECIEVSDDYKQRLIAATADDTLFTPLFDIANHHAFGGRPWPPGIAARVLSNQFTEKWRDRLDEVTQANESLMSEYRTATEQKDYETAVVYGGESVNDIHRIQPAEDIILGICDDAENRISDIF